MKITGSVQDFLTSLIVKDKNSTEILSKMTDAISSDQENIVLEFTDPDTNTVTKIPIPSLKLFQTRLDFLQKNMENMAGINSDTLLRDSDGKLKKVFVQKLLKEPSSLTTITTPDSFKIKTNWFFEDFLSPLLYVDFDYTGKFDVDVKKVEVTKLLLQIDTEAKANWFDGYDLRSDVEYSTLIEQLNLNSISYIPDVNIRDLAVKENVKYGDFSVIKIIDDSTTVNIDGVDRTVIKKKYQLDTLTYSNKNSKLKYTENLKVGDSLVINTNDKNTRLEITEIDVSKKTVVLNKIEGFDAISIGTDNLKLYNPDLAKINVEVPIGYNNYIALFIRPISSDSNIVADFYSPGTIFYSNELTINIDNDNTYTLADYYNNNVTDFGQYLLGVSKDSSPPAIFGITPDAPILTEDSFNVVEINTHLTNKKIIGDLKKLHNEKNTINAEVTELSNSIGQVKNKLSTKNYNSELERNSDLDTLKTTETERANKKETFNSLVTEINNLSTQQNVKVKPKYRLRGFWSIPTAKKSDVTSSQEIVQFIVSYRYLSKEGDGNPNQQIKFSDINGDNLTGTFSEWTEIKTDFRKRTLNETTGLYEWDIENIESSDVTNINQLDIPIVDGEKVQIRIKSVSEAGFPTNPLLSEWSSIIEKEFPAELSVDLVAENIVEQSKREEVKVLLDEEIKSLGITTHLDDSFPSNGKLFKHITKNIDSGFVDDSQNPIDLFEKIKEQDAKLIKLEESIKGGNLEDIQFSIIDENKNATRIKVGYENSVFAGYYADIVESETIPMGTIVTRVYTLQIKNNANIDLVFESLDKGASDSNSTITTINGIDYNYNLVPLATKSQSNHQTQKKGQFLYNRYKTITNKELYKNLGNSSLYNFGVSQTDAVVRNSQLNNLLPVSVTENVFLVHEDHPDVDSNGNYIGQLITLPKSLKNDGVHNAYDSNTKIAFEENDKFLVGTATTGALLYMLTDDQQHTNIRVDGNTIFSNKTILAGETIEIPIIFQFRMTDYYGNTANLTSLNSLRGRIDGFSNKRNITYTKTLGFDFYTKFGAQQGFDIKFTAKHRSSGLSLANNTGAGTQTDLFTV